MKTISLILFLASTTHAVDVSKIAKRLKNECGKCSEWVPVLEVLERGGWKDPTRILGCASQSDYKLNATPSDYELALAKARKMAGKLKKEKEAVLKLLR